MDINNSNSCNSKVKAYKNGKTFEDCKKQAVIFKEIILSKLLTEKEVPWTRILEITEHDELVFKLTLKYLRQNGCDIGNNKLPRVKKIE